MIKRVSLLWKQPGLSTEQLKAAWLGEHSEYAGRLPGLREYVVDFVANGPADGPAGIATVRFDDLASLNAAFGDPVHARELLRTRDTFAEKVQVFLVDEHVVVGGLRST
ncbi:MAG: EthD domain-containing protein [Rhizobiaceae bacterium]|nr:EthD domain-containing protein [Rhizobiaceae bacterium]